MKNSSIFHIWSQPNNHNPNNKTTKTVVRLTLSKHWEPPTHYPPTTTTTKNSKIHERTRIEQNLTKIHKPQKLIFSILKKAREDPKRLKLQKQGWI